MASGWEYKCNRCGVIQCITLGVFRLYDLPWQADVPEIDRVMCEEEEGYCYACNRVAVVEYLPHLDEYDHRIERVRAKTEDPTIQSIMEGRGQTRDEFIASDIRRIEDERRWRLERKSPPKCYACGSTSVASLKKLEAEGRGPYHLDCGGILESYNELHVNLGFFVERIPAEGPKQTRR